MEQSKLGAMMEGKTFTSENIDRMYQMVQEAKTPEEKTNVMKHSVFFAGQLPTDESNMVDIRRTRQQVGAFVPESRMDDTIHTLLSGLATQKLLLEKEDGSYYVNTKYEKSILKVRKIARAWQIEKEEGYKEEESRVKKMYQQGTRYYHAGDYEQAVSCFMNTVDMAEYRMGYYSLALMYKDGKGTDRSLDKALLYARCAIVRGAVIAESLEEEILSMME